MSMSLQTTYTQLPGTALLGQCRLGAEFTTLKNANASASQPVGSPVAFKPSGATSDLDATALANATDKVAGIIAHSDDYSVAWTDKNSVVHGELDATGIVKGALFSVIREGWIYVTCHTGCVPGERLFAAYNATGATYTAVGQMGNVAEGGHTIDCSGKGEWKSTATADVGAWLEVNFVSP